MYKLISKKISITLLGILLIAGCSGKSKNNDFDLSGLKIPKKNIAVTNDILKKVDKKEVELKLIPLDKRKEIENTIRYGKSDPFSATDDESNKFFNNFKLKGFISYKNTDYALVEYKEQKGIINLNSVGGINTKVLPKKASVRNINPSQETIKLSIEGEIYTIKLNL